MHTENLIKEQRIMIMMRKTLAKVVRDTTPSSPGLKRGISEETVQEIRLCLELISAREREMAEEQGKDITERPRYTDEPRSSNVVSISGLSSVKKEDDDNV